MTNKELQTAIDRTHEMLGNWAYDTENYKTLQGHLFKLLDMQQVRAANWTARPNEEEGTPC